MGVTGEEMQQKILEDVNKNGTVTSIDLARKLGEDHQKIIGAIKSLECLDKVIDVNLKSEKSWTCTEEGEVLLKEGSYEARLFFSLPPEGWEMKEIFAKLGNNANFAIGGAKKNKWITKEGDKWVRAVDNIEDSVQENLKAISEGNFSQVAPKVKDDYKKRKLLKEQDITIFLVSKGEGFTMSVSKQETELTKEMIESGTWATKEFKPYNFKAKGKLDMRPGYLHPLMLMRSEFRQIFLEMGFQEMPTNNFVESAFWNFDALFQPQQHPARDAHDTFYVAQPPEALSIPEEYKNRVAQTHSKGGYGSIGYQYNWSLDEAKKLLLRTHTTAVSARMLYKLAEEGFRPAKYFSIDRVYRNETPDATHLAEFHQLEGLVADYNLSIKHLMGIIKAFFEKIGLTNLRFKPTYNPYTEPSMEIFSYHSGLKKWVEIGNSGIFRPEMLRPMGLPDEVRVIAWGLSLERPAMIKYGISNIRDMVGPRVKMSHIEDNAICLMEKFGPKKKKSPTPTMELLTKRQDYILNQLCNLQKTVLNIAKKLGVELLPATSGQLWGGPTGDVVHDIVIYADPRRPPYSIRSLVSILSRVHSVYTQVHVHSSIKEISEKLQTFWQHVPHSNKERSKSNICIRLVWNIRGDASSYLQPALRISPTGSTEICGEANVCRYLSRIAEIKNPSLQLYESLSCNQRSLVDQVLDQSHSDLVLGNNKKRAAFLHSLNQNLRSNQFLTGECLTIADLVVLSAIYQLRLAEDCPKNVELWLKRCMHLPDCKHLL